MGGIEEGPFTFKELKMDARITPDTLARKEGSKEFAPIKSYKEFKELFKDEKEKEREEEEDSSLKWSKDGIITQEHSSAPGPFVDFIVLLLIVLLLWAIFWIFRK